MKKILAGITLAVALIAGSAVKAVPIDEAKLDISGLAQFGYNWSEVAGQNDQFDTNRLRIKIKAQPAEHIAFVSQLELTNNTSPAAFGSNVPATAVLSDAFGSDSKIVDMYVVLSYLDWATFLVGQLPTPVSYELNTDEYALETINYSQFVGIANRDRGIGMINPLSPEVQLISWVLNGVGSITGASNDVDDKDNYGTMLSYQPLQRLNIKAFANFGNFGVLSNTVTDMDVDALGMGVNYSLHGFHFFGEFCDAKIKMKNENVNPATTARVKTREWYIHGSYMIPETGLQLVARYDKYDVDTYTTGGEIKITTAGLNWDFEKNARLQLMHEFKNGSDNDETDLQLSIRF